MVKSKLPPRSGSSLLEAVEAHPWKGAVKFFFFFLKGYHLMKNKNYQTSFKFNKSTKIPNKISLEVWWKIDSYDSYERFVLIMQIINNICKFCLFIFVSSVLISLIGRPFYLIVRVQKPLYDSGTKRMTSLSPSIFAYVCSLFHIIYYIIHFTLLHSRSWNFRKNYKTLTCIKI